MTPWAPPRPRPRLQRAAENRRPGSGVVSRGTGDRERGVGRNVRKASIFLNFPGQLFLRGKSVPSAKQHGRPQASGPICLRAAKAV